MLGERTTQHAVGSCGHCGEMPLKIMLNVRDTQTHSGRRLVPLSAAKPIYYNTTERSIRPRVHMHCHKSGLLFARLAGKTESCSPPPQSPLHPHPTSQTLMQPTQVSGAAAGVKTQTVSIPRQTPCKTNIEECRKSGKKARQTWLTPKPA